MNAFYDLNKKWQWFIAIFMITFAGLIYYLWLELMMISFAGVLAIFFITPISQFLMTPFFKLSGVYKYLSPMLLVYSPTDKKYDLHNGTSFDYVFIYNLGTSGKRWQNKLLLYFIEGLLEIINEIENGRLPMSLEVRGSSYFFSARTAKRFGFEVSKTGWAEKFNVVINYLDLVWMYSLSKGRFVLPSLKNIQTATTTGEKLVRKKNELIKFQNYLNKASR